MLEEAQLPTRGITRRSSSSAAAGSFTVHSTNDVTPASQLASSTGRRSATPSNTVTGTGADAAALAAISRRYGSGSTATTSVTVAG